MPLCIAYIQRFADVLEPVRRFLARDRDLFAKPRIVVPTAGAKAWLWSEMAKMLGADGGVGPGHPGGDGIVANVEISYPGTILTLLQPPPGTTPDPWSFDRLTFAILEVISGPDAADLKIPLDIDREPLLVARRIAGLFDEYHVRRPGMILEWDSTTPSRHMSPTANDEQKEGVPIPDLLPDQDRWQFDLWRLVRRRLAAESPPRRATAAHRSPHAPLLVAGLQSLSWPQLQALQELGTRARSRRCSSIRRRDCGPSGSRAGRSRFPKNSAADRCTAEPQGGGRGRRTRTRRRHRSPAGHLARRGPRPAGTDRVAGCRRQGRG